MTWALLCRETFETELVSELLAPLNGHAVIDSTKDLQVEPGFVLCATPPLQPLSPAPFVFERQRMLNISMIEPAGLKPTAREIVVRILPAISHSTSRWTLHVFAPDVQENSLSGGAAALQSTLDEMIRQRFPAVHRRMLNHDETDPNRNKPGPNLLSRPDDMVLQVCVCKAGIFGCVMRADQLTDSAPGGVHRMRFDRHAPSRSYLKLEETFDRMRLHPLPGDTVVDLGAAPGGWTYSFLKCGCTVTAVDNADLRLPPGIRPAGRLLHLRKDGISFVPPPDLRPVDWLASDMLQVAGTNIGMLRKWVTNRWMRHFIFNVKIPQQDALQAIRPVHSFLRAARGLTFQIRQLYHDRREVTIWGAFIRS